MFLIEVGGSPPAPADGRRDCRHVGRGGSLCRNSLHVDGVNRVSVSDCDVMWTPCLIIWSQSRIKFVTMCNSHATIVLTLIRTGTQKVARKLITPPMALFDESGEPRVRINPGLLNKQGRSHELTY